MSMPEGNYRFTVKTQLKNGYYCAGTDSGGYPHLFFSLMGGVWEEMPLMMLWPIPSRPDRGDILRILEDPESDLIHLVVNNGQMITLSDCPKCTRIRQISRTELKDAFLQERRLHLVLADGREEDVSLEEERFRASYSFAKESCGKGGILVFLDEQAEKELPEISAREKLNIEDLDLFLRHKSSRQPIFFLCRSGMQADQAARSARRKGYRKSFSLGGCEEGLHVD